MSVVISEKPTGPGDHVLGHDPAGMTRIGV